MSTTDNPSLAHLDELPLADDRTEAWRALRSAAGIVEVDGTYFVTDAELVEHVGRHPEVFSSARAFDRLGSPVPMVPIAIDPPEHKRFRRLLDPFFGPGHLRALEPELRQQAVDLIEEIKAEGPTCDIVTDLAALYPTQVFLTLFGLPLEDRERLVGWKDSILLLTDPSNSEPNPAVLEHAIELYTYLTEVVKERRTGSGDDLLTKLMATRDEGGMTDEELIGLGFLFVLAGLDTVSSAVGFAFAFLAEHHDRRAEVVADPSVIPTLIEELLRVEVPVPFPPRVTTEAVELGGTKIPAGADVTMALGAANRDPSQYERADDVGRDQAKRHYSFGVGPHRCLGSHLARLELRIILEEWHRLIPDYSLAPGATPTVRWPASTLALESVPLRLGQES